MRMITVFKIKKTLETPQVHIPSPMSRDHARVAKMAEEYPLHPVNRNCITSGVPDARPSFNKTILHVNKV